MHALSVLLLSLTRHRGGVTAIEYALIVALLSITIAPQATSVGKQLSGLMHNIGAFLAGAPRTEPDPPIP